MRAIAVSPDASVVSSSVELCGDARGPHSESWIEETGELSVGGPGSKTTEPETVEGSLPPCPSLGIPAALADTLGGGGVPSFSRGLVEE